MKRIAALMLVSFLAAMTLTLPSPVLADDGVIRAVLFYSPSCGYCHQIMTEDLPPLMEVYGQQLDIVAVDTAHPEGQVLYQAAIQRFNIGPERRGVPTLIVGETVLVGSLEIPQQFPVLIETYLAAGGVAWPDIPGFLEALNSSEPAGEASEPPSTGQTDPAAPAPASENDGKATQQESVASEATDPTTDAGIMREFSGAISNNMLARFRQDLAGNSLSVLVLLGMIAAVLRAVLRAEKATVTAPSQPQKNRHSRWAVPLLITLGIVVSAYMAFVETTQTTAVCGPVGDCNTVQQSEYAQLFGLLPIGIVGLAGYSALGLAWALAHFCHGRCAHRARFLLAAMALAGTLFSIYLTFLEPFVIGATCLWCLTSAVSITLILLFTGNGWRTSFAGTGDKRPRRAWQGSQSQYLREDKRL